MRLTRVHSWTERNLNLVSVTEISLDTVYSDFLKIVKHSMNSNLNSTFRYHAA